MTQNDEPFCNVTDVQCHDMHRTLSLESDSDVSADEPSHAVNNLHVLCKRITQNSCLNEGDIGEFHRIEKLCSTTLLRSVLLHYGISDALDTYTTGQIGWLSWRVCGQVQADVQCVIEVRMRRLVSSTDTLMLTFKDSERILAEIIVPQDDDYLIEFVWEPIKPGMNLINVVGTLTSNSEVANLSLQRALRITVEKRAESRGATTLITTSPTGEIVLGNKNFVPVQPFNKSDGQVEVFESSWNSVPVVKLNKLHNKSVHLREYAYGTDVTCRPDAPVERTTRLPHLIRADKPLEYPCFLCESNDTYQQLFCGKSIIIGRNGSSDSVPDQSTLSVVSFDSQGEVDLDSTSFISRRSFQLSMLDDRIILTNLGSNALRLNETSVSKLHPTQLFNKSLTTASITLHKNTGSELGVDLSIWSINNHRLPLSITELLTYELGPSHGHHGQPGCIVIDQKCGNEIIRSVWIIGVVKLNDIFIRKSDHYSNFLIVNWGGKLWITNKAIGSNCIYEMTQQCLSHIAPSLRLVDIDQLKS